MLKSISQLKSKWNKEKGAYKRQEVGSGVQKFVKEVLESEEIFNLKEGLKSTSLERRKNEFLEEEIKKGRNQADIVIFIDSEIIIPIEVERYENIDAGKGQILQYQLDWQKKYGILTDGYTWRFYNNNSYRKFTLQHILEETSLFLEFWKEYIKLESYYISFFEPPSQTSLFKDIERISVESDRQIFFEDITQLIGSFKNKLKIEGYFNGLEKKEKEKRAIEITYAYIIQFILYKTLVDNEFDAFAQEFQASVKKIHTYLDSERYKDILGVIDNISAEISKNVYRPFAKEQEFISRKLRDLYRSIENKLSDVSPWLDIFVFIKKYDFANVRNEIFGYIYENYLKELFEEEKKGQYFTDPAIVNFMLEQIGYTTQDLKTQVRAKKDKISIVDPSCGSGTFLYSAVDSIIKSFDSNSEEASKEIEGIINNNIFGLDIAEFPLYLAEMNILMRMLPLIVSEKYNNPVDKKIKVFLTKDSIAEFIDARLENTLSDFQRRGSQLEFFSTEIELNYESYVRDEGDLAEMKQSMRPPRRRFDFVIGNPPYVGYNECSKQGVLIFELMRQGKAKLNDIYGVNLHSVPNNPKKYRPNPNLYAFFIALGLTLLKDNGKLCYIIPQTILTAGDLDVLRYHLARFATIEKIITFSGRMFVGRGIKQNKEVATSSLIFVASRRMPNKLHEVEIINYEHPNDTIEETLQNILIGKKINKKKILQNNFLKNAVNWNFIKQDKILLDFHEEYKKNTGEISIYYNHVLAKHQFKSKFYFDSGYNIDEKQLLRESPKDNYYLYPKIKSDFWTIKEGRGFWPNIRKGQSPHAIQLRQANQGYNLLDSTYKIIWSYVNPSRFHFSSIPLIWARNQICAIGSENKEELLYLFSILNSSIIMNILSSNLKSETEKDYLVSTSAVKEFVRVPRINEDNQFIKYEIIKRTEEMLALEEKILTDFVDFSGVMVQKFDNVTVENSHFILIKDKEKIKCKIKEKTDLIKKVIKTKFADAQLLDKEKIILSELKSLLVIDSEKQKLVKEYIDDLVFALYFNVELKEVGLEKANSVQRLCDGSKFYSLVSGSK